MKVTLKFLWSSHRVLLIGFIAAALLSAFFLFRLAGSLIYWPQHRDVEIKGWMTLGYIAQSYEVELDTVLLGTGLAEIPRKRITLKELSELLGVPASTLEESILHEIQTKRDAE